MPLLEPVALTDLPDPADLGPVHFIAVGGSGMSSVASVFLQLGVRVSGSDRSDSKYLRNLEAEGARVHVGHRADQVGDARTVVISSAIREDNSELAEARARGLRVLHRSAALALLLRRHRGIAVAGTHGKTTTTGMIATVLDALGLSPTSVLGGALTGAATGGRLGTGEWMVVEADESDGSFLQYPAEVAVVTNVDPDHLVNWGTAERYRDGFLRFATGPSVRLLVTSADDPGARAVTERVLAARPDLPVRTFGADPDADVRYSDVALHGTGSTFVLRRRKADDGGPVELAVPGDYNVKNAAATYAVATAAVAEGDERVVRRALESYGGTYRRFQLIGTVDGIRVFDDYAHHPTEVAATVGAARTAAGPKGRVVACFQPHLYTRTRDFSRELGAALAGADEAVVMDVCGDREDPLPGITGELVSRAVPAGTARVTYEPVWDAAPAAVAAVARPGDLVVTIGCGDVTKIAPLIVAELAATRGARSGGAESVGSAPKEVG